MDDAMKAILAAFGEIAASRRVGGAARRMTLAACCAGLAAAFAAAAAGCAVTALWIFLLPAVGPIGAPLISAAVLLLLCGALVAAIWRLLRHRPAPVAGQTSPDAAAPALLIAEASRLIEENKGAALLAALLAGAATENATRK
jgi:hypothetical protein